MSVLKNKRKASQFEVFHHLYKVRKDITDLLLRDFGYSFEKAEKRLIKQFGGRKYAELTEAERERYDSLKRKYESFDDWYGSWFRNHYRIMSRLQRENMDTLYNQLKKEVYHNVQNHSG